MTDWLKLAKLLTWLSLVLLVAAVTTLWSVRRSG